MVECSKCGNKNQADARYCSKCGESLEASWEKNLEERAEKWGEEFGRRAEEWGEQFGKRAEEECFGLPSGGAIFGLVLGLVIVLAGFIFILQQMGIVTGGLNLLPPFFAIVFGLLCIAGAIFALTRR